MTRHIPTLPAMFVDVLDTPPRSLPDHRMNIADDHENERSADVCQAAQARCRLGRIATKAELAAPRLSSTTREEHPGAVGRAGAGQRPAGRGGRLYHRGRAGRDQHRSRADRQRRPTYSRWAIWTTGCGRAPRAARSGSLPERSACAPPTRRAEPICTRCGANCAACRAVAPG